MCGHNIFISIGSNTGLDCSLQRWSDGDFGIQIKYFLFYRHGLFFAEGGQRSINVGLWFQFLITASQVSIVHGVIPCSLAVTNKMDCFTLWHSNSLQSGNWSGNKFLGTDFEQIPSWSALLPAYEIIWSFPGFRRLLDVILSLISVIFQIFFLFQFFNLGVFWEVFENVLKTRWKDKDYTKCHSAFFFFWENPNSDFRIQKRIMNP